jgi:hypothetical protein
MSYNKQSVLNNTATANTAVVITVPASSDVRRYIRGVRAAFDNTGVPPETSSLTITSGGVTVLNTFVSDERPEHIDFGVPGIAGEPAATVVVTLAALEGKIGRLSVFVDES